MKIVTGLERIKFLFGLALLKPRTMFLIVTLINNKKRHSFTLEKKQKVRLSGYLNYWLTIKKEKQLHFYADEVYEAIQNLPIINKNDIKNNKNYKNDKVPPSSYKLVQTGGSTGEPLKYRIDKKCDAFNLAMLIRGWSYAGYSCGDRVAVLAGGSLVKKDTTLKSRLVQWILNWKKYSSYGVNENDLEKYYRSIKKWQASFLRGYVSSIYEFAKFINKNNYELKFQGVFTTGEMLSEAQREYIQKTFGCKVYNNYGLNDGGVSAFECSKGSLHIDVERAYLEAVNDQGSTIFDKPGRLLATSFHNRSTFFIRYDTGDLGSVSSHECACGLPFPVLKSLVGRSTDALYINNSLIGSPVLTVLMSRVDVNRYQFLCYDDHVDLVLDVDRCDFGEKDSAFIKQSLFSQVGKFDLRMSFNESDFVETSAGKHKVVVSYVSPQ